MIALMLQLPSEAYLSEQAELVDVDGIHHSREWLKKQLAVAHVDLLREVYAEKNTNVPYQPEGEQIANRSLKNIALQYLSLLQDDSVAELAKQQYENANNMTDRMAALYALLNGGAAVAGKYAQQCLDAFYRQFKDEPLAIDQWLIAQATVTASDTLDKVKRLTEHPCFSLKNPNKVRSLIGAFCNNNLINFHRADGAGYDFLCANILALDKLNPQIAARLVTPLTRWGKYDKARQQLMAARLQQIVEQEKLSKDVFEVVSKSLPEQ